MPLPLLFCRTHCLMVCSGSESTCKRISRCTVSKIATGVPCVAKNVARVSSPWGCLPVCHYSWEMSSGHRYLSAPHCRCQLKYVQAKRCDHGRESLAVFRKRKPMLQKSLWSRFTTVAILLADRMGVSRTITRRRRGLRSAVCRAGAGVTPVRLTSWRTPLHADTVRHPAPARGLRKRRYRQHGRPQTTLPRLQGIRCA